MGLKAIIEDSTRGLEFVRRHGVYPSEVLYDFQSFKDVHSYWSGSSVLVLLHGFTSLSKFEFLKFISDVLEVGVISLEDVYVLTDIPLDGYKHRYYLYEANPFKSNLMLFDGRKGVLESDLLEQSGCTVSQDGVISKLRVLGTEGSAQCVEHPPKRVLTGYLGDMAKSNDGEDSDIILRGIKNVNIFKSVRSEKE